MSAFNTPKTTALAPMASVSVKTAVMVKPGDLRSWRSANRTSAQIDSSVGHCHTSRLRSSTAVRLPKATRALRCAASALTPSRNNCSARSSICSRISSLRSSYGLLRRKMFGIQFIGNLPLADSSVGCGLARIQNQCNACKHALETGNLLLQMAQPGSSDLVGSYAAIVRRDAPLGLHQFGFEEPLERRIERAFLHLEQIIRPLLDVLDQRVSVGRLTAQRLENHHFECAGE